MIKVVNKRNFVLHDDRGAILCMFSKSIGVRDFNEVEVLAILEALRIFFHSFQGRLIMKVILLMLFLELRR